MSEAGLTAGGFYSHFSSKEALFAEAMAAALAPVDKGHPSINLSTDSPDALADLIRGYLSRTHRDSMADGCPLPALTSDVARKSDATRESYERQFLSFLNDIEARLPESSTTRERALAIMAQCVGGLMLARAVKNEKLSDQILRSCRLAAMTITEDDSGRTNEQRPQR